ncbi:hypothetical protein AX16_000937 [Volvariella volvacea WC 439]|nr:hypothetical protein AX16_000937 [Volvariella volvacea WC 439]
MALNASPRKVVPLATGEEPRPRGASPAPSATKRVFFCGIVVEGSEGGRRLPDDIQDLVLSFGSTVTSNNLSDMLPSSNEQPPSGHDQVTQRKRALTDTSALQSVINELVSSEQSYVRRLKLLKSEYADPLRNFARSKDTAIIPAYEAKTLFGNIDNLIPVNEAFLTDLEKMSAPNGPRAIGGVGDVTLKHFKELRGFELYKQYYSKREDAQHIFEREVAKRSSRFAAYIDHIKYAAPDVKNRIGLRELLMEPVQRIPRYTLLFRNMLKYMAPDDPQRAKLTEADEIASKIALAEADEQTKRAAIFYCLSATIDGFPPDLFSNSRRFIDCIDVEDIITDGTSSSTTATSTSAPSLHCSLFLFDDKLMIVKRPGNGEKGGRMLSGLNDLDKLTKGGGIPSGKKKSGMSCKGVVDITDVVATDVGGADIHLYLENPPMDQTERWSGRSFRSLAVVHPPSPINYDPIATENDKQRFLEKLWLAQAVYRARAGQSVVLRAEEQEVESRYGRLTTARTYYNVYQRTAFLQEPRKTKVVVHVDPLGTADPIPFGIGGPPFVRIKIQPLAGGLCGYSVSSSDPAEENEEAIVQTERVPLRVIQTIHQFGLFQFRTGKNSLPPTPTARSKVAKFGLDALSRNIFSSRPASAMGDFFGGSISGHRRTKSTISRSSMHTQSTSTGDGSTMKFSQRSGSTHTAATSVMDESLRSTKSSRSKKSAKRTKSPGEYVSEPEPMRSISRSSSRSQSTSGGWDTEPSDAEDDDNTIMEQPTDPDSSDFDLARQLALARRNSKNQHSKPLPPLNIEQLSVGSIYEEEYSQQTLRPGSIYSNSARPTTPVQQASQHSRSRSTSRHSMDRRPLGPRSPSPLPPLRSPFSSTSSLNLLSMDDDPAREATPPPITPPPSAPSILETPTPTRDRFAHSGIPRSKRQSFFPTAADMTPRAYTNNTIPGSIEPLSIKKKTSLRSSAGGSPTSRKTYVRNSPLSRNSVRITSPQRFGSQSRKHKFPSSVVTHVSDTAEEVIRLSESTKEDVESSRRTVKRIKLELDGFRASASTQDPELCSRSPSPDKALRPALLASTSAPKTKAAQDRMEEMRLLISKRNHIEGLTPRKARSAAFEPGRSMNISPIAPNADGLVRSVDILVAEADGDLARAISYQDQLQEGVKELVAEFRVKMADLERSRLELQNCRRQCEVVKSLLADATAEKEVMYEAFNEELDGMYNDLKLPDDEAWAAMAYDLRRAKEARNAFSKENSQLRRQLAEMELQREEWATLLRSHGLIS